MDKDAATKSPAELYGRLYLANSGWLLLEVPNSLVRGLFNAMQEPGIELPYDDEGKLNAHISVMNDLEVETIGADKITERGHVFAYRPQTLVRLDRPSWKGVSAVWFLRVGSPELERLRKSYGLSARPHNNEHDFHITYAVRRVGVLQAGPASKLAK